MARQVLLLSICTGAILEVIVLLYLLLTNSTESMSAWQTVAEYTQAPSALILDFVGRLRLPFGSNGVTLVFAIAFIAQTGVFALPVWMVLKRFPEDRPLSK